MECVWWLKVNKIVSNIDYPIKHNDGTSFIFYIETKFIHEDIYQVNTQNYEKVKLKIFKTWMYLLFLYNKIIKLILEINKHFSFFPWYETSKTNN